MCYVLPVITSPPQLQHVVSIPGHMMSLNIYSLKKIVIDFNYTVQILVIELLCQFLLRSISIILS